MNLFDKLATEDLATFAGSGITKAELDNFFTVLGGANVAVQFAPKIVKGTQDKFAAKHYSFVVKGDGGGALALGGFEGSCGGRWTF